MEDFAGGTVVHINAGAAGVALTLVLGKRIGWPKERMRPHNVPFVLLGAGLLWFGWLGFNAGSELAADQIAGFALVNTIVATAAAMLGWLVVERIRDGRPTTLGLLPVSSPVSSRLRRRAPSSARSVRSRSASPRGSSVPSPCP